MRPQIVRHVSIALVACHLACAPAGDGGPSLAEMASREDALGAACPSFGTGRFLWVLLPSPQCLHVHEVEVYEGGTNIALGRPAAQSSEYGSGWIAGKAVDGVLGGYGNFSHTSCSAADFSPWLRIDLGVGHRVDRVVIHNRSDCCTSRFNLASVILSNANSLSELRYKQVNVNGILIGDRLDGSKLKIDLVAPAGAGCGANASCDDGACACDPGFVGDGTTCAPGTPPSCAEDNGGCSQDPFVACHDLPGSTECDPCPDGYAGDGRTCTDVDECLVDNGGCSASPFVPCTNTVGSSACGPCPSGYDGDGRACTPRPCLDAYTQAGYATSCTSATCEASCAAGYAGTPTGTVQCDLGSWIGAFGGCLEVPPAPVLTFASAETTSTTLAFSGTARPFAVVTLSDGTTVDALGDGTFSGTLTAGYGVRSFTATATVNGVESAASAVSTVIVRPAGLEAPSPIDEGGSATVGFGIDGASGFQFAFACHGTLGAAGSASSTTCAFDDDGSFDVSARISFDGGSADYTATVHVDGVAPVAPVSGPATVEEGSTASLTFEPPIDPSGADVAAGFSFAYDCDGGGLELATYTGPGSPFFTCTWPDGPSAQVVRTRVIDADGAFTESTIAVQVTNAPPVPTILGAPGSIPEGTGVALGATAIDPGVDDAATFAWTVTRGGQVIAIGAGASFDLLPTDNGSYQVQVIATDADGGEGSDGRTISVTNVPPAATFEAPAAVLAGTAFTLSLTGATDPSSADVAAGLTYAFDCGDGAGYAAASAANSRSCATGAPGTLPVKGKVLDQDGGATEYTNSVTINSVAPTATFAGPAAVGEGSVATFTFTAPSTPAVRYAFDCSGGELAGATYASAGSAASVACGFDDGPGTRTVSGRIIDFFGASTLYTATVGVQNVSPTASFGSVSGAATTCTSCAPFVAGFANVQDPSGADRSAGFRYAYDCLGGALASASYASSGASPFVSCAWASAGNWTIRGRVFDKDGGYAEATFAVTVSAPADWAKAHAAVGANAIAALPAAALDAPGHRQALINSIEQAISALQKGNVQTAVQKLRAAIERTDGCARAGAVDAGDYVVTCPAQALPYAELTTALEAID